MTGRRVYTDAEGHLLLQPGDYGQDKNGDWYARPPDNHAGNLGGHEVVEHDDGTITVSPSILIHAHGDTAEWHGYLERGVWRTVK